MTKKYSWELTREEMEDELDKIRWHPYHDFDSDAPVIAKVYSKGGRRAYSASRFITNFSVSLDKDWTGYVYAYSWTGVPIHISKYAYDANGRRCKYMCAAHVHESIPDANIDEYKRKARDAWEEFEQRYGWHCTNGWFDREQFEKDFPFFGRSSSNTQHISIMTQVTAGHIQL